MGVCTLRLIFWMPPMLHVFFGVSRVRFWTHFWGSLVGYVPPLRHPLKFFENSHEGGKTGSKISGKSSCLLAFMFNFPLKRLQNEGISQVPPLLATAYFGQKVFDALRAAPPSVWAGMGAVTLAIVVVSWLVARRSRREVIPS